MVETIRFCAETARPGDRILDALREWHTVTGLEKLANNACRITFDTGADVDFGAEQLLTFDAPARRLATLREAFPRGATVFIVMRGRSRAGLRYLDVYAIRANDAYWYSRRAAHITGERMNNKRHCVATRLTPDEFLARLSTCLYGADDALNCCVL